MKSYIVCKGKSVSIRKDPSCPYNDEAVYGEIKKGETVRVDDSKVLFDWHGNTYYRVDDGVHYDAYIITTAVKEATANGRRRVNNE